MSQPQTIVWDMQEFWLTLSPFLTLRDHVHVTHLNPHARKKFTSQEFLTFAQNELKKINTRLAPYKPMFIKFEHNYANRPIFWKMMERSSERNLNTISFGEINEFFHFLRANTRSLSLTFPSSFKKMFLKGVIIPFLAIAVGIYCFLSPDERMKIIGLIVVSIAFSSFILFIANLPHTERNINNEIKRNDIKTLQYFLGQKMSEVIPQELSTPKVRKEINQLLMRRQALSIRPELIIEQDNMLTKMKKTTFLGLFCFIYPFLFMPKMAYAEHLSLLKEMFTKVTVEKDAHAILQYYRKDFELYTNGKKIGFNEFLQQHEALYKTPIQYTIRYDEPTFVEQKNKIAGRVFITTKKPNESEQEIEVILVAEYKNNKLYRLWELTYPDWTQIKALQLKKSI